MDAPLSFTDAKFLLNQRRETKFVIVSFFSEPRSRYIANQNGSAKETISQKIGANIEMLVCFIWRGSQDRTDINHHYQITMNQH